MIPHKLFGLLLVLSLSAFTLVACGDDDSEATPPDREDGGDSTGHSGRGGSGGSGKAGNGSSGSGSEAGDGGVDNDAGPDGPKAGKGGNGASGTSASGSGGESGSDATCIDDPEEGEDFLNRCSDSQCEPFDNEERVPRLAEGLPDP